MSKDFSPGDRIRISDDYHWAKDELGTVTQPPEYIVNFSDGWDGTHRNVFFCLPRAYARAYCLPPLRGSLSAPTLVELGLAEYY